MSSQYNREQMERIKQALLASQRPIKPVEQPYLASSRNSPDDQTLRQLLLAVHEDPMIAQFIRDRRLISGLYDPEPDDERSWCLDW